MYDVRKREKEAKKEREQVLQRTRNNENDIVRREEKKNYIELTFFLFPYA